MIQYIRGPGKVFFNNSGYLCRASDLDILLKIGVTEFFINVLQSKLQYKVSWVIYIQFKNSILLKPLNKR